jgi:hypothetical protein
MSLVRLAASASLLILTSALAGCADADQDVRIDPDMSLKPEGKGGGGPAAFTVSAAGASFSTAVDSFQYQLITVTTSHHPVVIQNPATLTGDVGPRADNTMIFSDTQSGSCWQKYESHGNPIPAQTSCTIQVNFHPDAVRTYDATLTVSQCTSWAIDPTWGFIVCSALGSSESVSLTGQGT